MSDPTDPSPTQLDTYAGIPRFTLELEFVQSLGNPYYLHHLASQHYFADPAFLNYLEYLQYWKQPRYAKFLSYPETTLRVLDLLENEAFRKDMVSCFLLSRRIGVVLGVLRVRKGRVC